LPYPRIVFAVCSVDLALSALSKGLAPIRIGTTNRGLGFYFSEDGFLLATSDVSIPSWDNDGNPIRMPLVNSSLVNATMAYILSASGIPVEAFSRYAEVSLFYNRYTDIVGERSIVSVQIFHNADNTTTFFLVLVTPYSDFFQVFAYANMVALLVIFLAILPTVILMTAIWSHFCISKPLESLRWPCMIFQRNSPLQRDP
jgi:hypothetical protein